MEEKKESMVKRVEKMEKKESMVKRGEKMHMCFKLKLLMEEDLWLFSEKRCAVYSFSSMMHA